MRLTDRILLTLFDGKVEFLLRRILWVTDLWGWDSVNDEEENRCYHANERQYRPERSTKLRTAVEGSLPKWKGGTCFLWNFFQQMLTRVTAKPQTQIEWWLTRSLQAAHSKAPKDCFTKTKKMKLSCKNTKFNKILNGRMHLTTKMLIFSALPTPAPPLASAAILASKVSSSNTWR